MRTARICLVVGCVEKHRTNGFCKKHYWKKWYSENSEKRKLYQKNYISENPNYTSDYQKKNNKKCNARSNRYKKNNPAIVNARNRLRYACKINATPAWANHVAIGEYYALAAIKTRLTGEPWHVDHQVPLHNKIVCGLHTDYNLQVIRGTDNSSKGNRRWPDMPESI